MWLIITSSGNPERRRGRIAIFGMYSMENVGNNEPTVRVGPSITPQLHVVRIVIRRSRLLFPRPLEGSSLWRGRPLATKRSLAETAQDPLEASPGVSCIQQAASSWVHPFSINASNSRMSPTRSAERGMLSSVAVDSAKGRV